MFKLISHSESGEHM